MLLNAGYFRGSQFDRNRMLRKTKIAHMRIDSSRLSCWLYDDLTYSILKDIVDGIYTLAIYSLLVAAALKFSYLSNDKLSDSYCETECFTPTGLTVLQIQRFIKCFYLSTS